MKLEGDRHWTARASVSLSARQTNIAELPDGRGSGFFNTTNFHSVPLGSVPAPRPFICHRAWVDNATYDDPLCVAATKHESGYHVHSARMPALVARTGTLNHLSSPYYTQKNISAFAMEHLVAEPTSSLWSRKFQPISHPWRTKADIPRVGWDQRGAFTTRFPASAAHGSSLTRSQNRIYDA